MSHLESRPVRAFLIAPPIASWGLERLLSSAHPRFELRGVAGGVDEALPMLACRPLDVVLLDFDGNEAADTIEVLAQSTTAGFVMITASQDQTMLHRAVLAGVRGVVKRDDAPATLLKALEKVHEGGYWIDRDATGRIFMEVVRQKATVCNDPEQLKISSLTTRERQTIAAVASDVSVPAKVIAGRLCISEHTLRNHLTSIYSKLDVSNRLDLYAYAMRHRLNKPGHELGRKLNASHSYAEFLSRRQAPLGDSVHRGWASPLPGDSGVCNATADVIAAASHTRTSLPQAA